MVFIHIVYIGCLDVGEVKRKMFTPGGEIETAIMAMSQWTGSIFLTILMILIVVIMIGLVLPLPLEWTSIIILPLLLVLMAYESMFYPAGAAFLLYLSFIMGKALLTR